MTTQQDERAGQVPLYEQLASVPKESRLVIDEGPHSTRFIPVGRMCHEAAAALLEADAKGGEAVAWRSWSDFLGYGYWDTKEEAAMHSVSDYEPEPLYTRPQQAAQVPLTEDQICKAGRERLAYELDDFLAGARYAEAAHGIGKAERTCGACGKAGCVAGECGDTPVGIGKDQG